MSRRLVLAAGVSFLLTVAPASGGTPFGGDDGGFVPPDPPTKRCEEAVLKKAQTLGHQLFKCQVKAADRALRGETFDEETCEQNIVDGFALRIAALIADGGCPSCTAPMSAAAADATRGFVDTINGDIYCAPGTPFGDDDAGNVPPDRDTGRCEDRMARNVDKFLHCVRICHFKAGRRAFRGGAFDDETCEQDCRTKILTVPGCVACLDTAGVDGIAMQSEQFADGTLGSIYCASPGGAFLGE